MYYEEYIWRVGLRYYASAEDAMAINTDTAPAS